MICPAHGVIVGWPPASLDDFIVNESMGAHVGEI